MVHPLWRIGRRFFKKPKLELLYDPAISLQGIYPEKNMIRRDTCTPTFFQNYVQQPRHGSNLNVR